MVGRVARIAIVFAVLSADPVDRPARARGCAMPAGSVATQSGSIALGRVRLRAVALSIADPNDERVRLLVRDASCRTWWDETRPGLEARFDVRRLGTTALLQFVVMEAFGDGTGYDHELLVTRGGALRPALPMVWNSGKDGFFLGRLRDGGEGIVTWVADPTGAEADPHPYVVTTWRWDHGRFAAPTRSETKRAYSPSDSAVPRGDLVARAIGLPYRDQTGTALFMDTGRLLDRLDAVEQDR